MYVHTRIYFHTKTFYSIYRKTKLVVYTIGSTREKGNKHRSIFSNCNIKINVRYINIRYVNTHRVFIVMIRTILETVAIV